MTDLQPLAWIGAITGPLGVFLGCMAFVRDAPRLKVDVVWDNQPVFVRDDGVAFQSAAILFKISIANIGRRPIYVSHLHIGSLVNPNEAYVFTQHLSGTVLTEGSKPYEVLTSQSDLPDWCSQWWRIRATVVDAAGRKYHSNWTTKKPESATEDAPPLAPAIGTIWNWIVGLRPS